MRCCTGVQSAEMLGRTRAMCTDVRARALWPWRTQHLWQQGSKWQWWWTLWDCGSLLGSKVHCTAESEAWAAYGPGGTSSKALNMTEFMTYRPYTQMELVDLGKQFQQMQGGPLLAWLLQLWDTGVDSAPVGFLRVLTERSRRMVCKIPFWKCEDYPKGSQNFPGSHLGYMDANMGWSVWRYSVKAFPVM